MTCILPVFFHVLLLTSCCCWLAGIVAHSFCACTSPADLQLEGSRKRPHEMLPELVLNSILLLQVQLTSTLPVRWLAVCFLSKFSRDNEARCFSLKGNARRHEHDTYYVLPHSLLSHPALLHQGWLNSRLSDPKRKTATSSLATFSCKAPEIMLTALSALLFFKGSCVTYTCIQLAEFLATALLFLVPVRVEQVTTVQNQLLRVKKKTFFTTVNTL